MKSFISILLFLTVISLPMNLFFAQSKSAAGFEKLKSLAGQWEGNGMDGKESVSVKYQLVSSGSAVMELLQEGKEGQDMVTVYHLDGDQLMMTHYCSVGNQPRMQAKVPEGEVKNLDFTFMDGSNMAAHSDGHMDNLTFTFLDKDHITQVWTWHQDGKDMYTTFELERKK